MFDGADSLEHHAPAQFLVSFAQGGVQQALVFLAATRRDVPVILNRLPDAVNPASEVFDQQKLPCGISDDYANSVPRVAPSLAMQVGNFEPEQFATLAGDD